MIIYVDEFGREHNFSNYSIGRLSNIWAYCPGAAAVKAEEALIEKGFTDFNAIEAILLGGD